MSAKKKKKKKGFFKRVVGWFKEAFDWVQDTLSDGEVRKAVLEDIGLNPGQSPPPPNFPKDKLDSIGRYQQAVDPDAIAFASAIADIKTVFDAGKSFVDQFREEGGEAAAEELAHRFFELMSLNYIRHRYPTLYFLSQPFGFVEETVSVLGPGKMYLERFASVFGAPFQHLEGVCWPPANAAEAKQLSDVTLAPFSVALAFWDKTVLKIPLAGRILPDLTTKEVIYSWDGAPGSLTPVGDEIAARTLTFAYDFNLHKDEETRQQLGSTLHLTMQWVPADQGGPGLLFGVGGAGEFSTPLTDDWHLRVRSTASSVIDFLIAENFAVHGPSDAALQIAFEQPPDPSGLPNALPDAKGTRLEFERASVTADLSTRGAGIELDLRNGALVLDPADGDGFIAKVLPKGETRINFDLGLGVATGRGFYIKGGTGLEALIPIAKSLGPVHLQHVLVGLVPTTEPKPARIALEVSAGLGIKLGPVHASVDRIGMEMALAFPGSGVDLQFGFKPPDGVGLRIDAKAVSGGGYLFYDRANAEYAGVVHLTIEKFATLKAIGLLTTRMPDGSKGFSLLLIISAEDFKPLPIGFGFLVTGIGGLLGVNRTFREDALFAGLKNHALDSIMFPEAPIRNAPQIVSNLNAVFPPAEGHHLFGLMAQISWGTPALFTLELGLVLEFGERLRLIVLGQVASLLPDKKNDLLRLHMDAFGVIDFDRDTARLDATLHDSRLLKVYALTGDMAMRMSWGASKSFALAIGGLHPGFPPPENFPKLARVAISLSSGSNPRIRLAAYVAITSNTVQFGAKAELFAKVSKFSIEGQVSWDVLIEIQPFSFLAEYRASVQLKKGSTNLFKVSVEGAVSGPRPLHVRGKATFEILWWDASVSFDKTLIEGARPPLPAAVNVLQILKAALREPNNWNSSLDAEDSRVASVRVRAREDEVALQPFGKLAVRQNVVPLNQRISRFGNTQPSGQREFSVQRVTLGGATQSITPLEDQFAPAQFFDMSDDEKISSPSFELMDAGLEIGDGAIAFAEPGDADNVIIDKEIAFETVYIEPDTPKSERAGVSHLDISVFSQLALRDVAGPLQFRAEGATVQTERTWWSIASAADLRSASMPEAGSGDKMTYAGALQVLKNLKKTDPAAAEKLQIVPSREVVR